MPADKRSVLVSAGVVLLLVELSRAVVSMSLLLPSSERSWRVRMRRFGTHVRLGLFCFGGGKVVVVVDIWPE